MEEAKSQRMNDFEKLQKEYRNMELNRKAYADETHQVLRRQQATIEKLKRDNEALKGELALETRGQSRAATTQQQAILAQLQDAGDNFSQKIEVEQRNLKVLTDQTNLMKQKILHQRKNMGGVNAARENQQMIQKQIRILENRLDKALIKFNEALAHNKQLREEIDNLRQERVVFDTIYRKLEKELQDKKKQMANIIEVSNLAYEQRDANQMEIAALEAANRKEHEEFEEQIAELNRIIEQDKRRAHFLSKQGPGERGAMSIEEEQQMKSKLTQATWGLTKDKVSNQVSVERVQNFEEAFNKIREATAISDIDELVRTFIKSEDQNFSLFNYVNEQTNEIEKLEEQIQSLREEEQKYAQESGDDVNQHKQLLKELEVKLQATEGMAEKYEVKCQEAQKTINSLKIGIQSIFNKIDCSSSSAMSEILADGTVTEANMMQFLGMIEQRTNEVLQTVATMARAAGDGGASVLGSPTPGGPPGADGAAGGGADGAGADAAAAGGPPSPLTVGVPGSPTPGGPPGAAITNILGLGPPTPMGQDLIHIQPPNLEDYSSDEDSDDDDEDARPLTRDELKMKTLKGISRRQNREAARAGQRKAQKRPMGMGRTVG